MSCSELIYCQVQDDPDEYFLKSYVLTKRNISWGIYISPGNHQHPAPFAFVVMSTVHPASESPPARAVERMREIIVGRQLERIEQRLERLEANGGAAHQGDVASEPRLAVVEARLEAMEQMIQRMGEQIRMEEMRRAEIWTEVLRMALHVQQLADARSPHPAGAAVQQMEERMGAWLGQWQLAMQAHLESRDVRLMGQFRSELSSLWAHVQLEMARARAGANGHSEVEERFRQIAEAARVLAACAAGPGMSEAQKS
jgi:hypothetical protein